MAINGLKLVQIFFTFFFVGEQSCHRFGYKTLTKNRRNRKIDFLFVLEHCATFWTQRWKRLYLRGGGDACHPGEEPNLSLSISELLLHIFIWPVVFSTHSFSLSRSGKYYGGTVRGPIKGPHLLNTIYYVKHFIVEKVELYLAQNQRYKTDAIPFVHN